MAVVARAAAQGSAAVRAVSAARAEVAIGASRAAAMAGPGCCELLDGAELGGVALEEGAQLERHVGVVAEAVARHEGKVSAGDGQRRLVVADAVRVGRARGDEQTRACGEAELEHA
eukprot:2019530-Pleurochrysis_carterae.AAC.1